MPKQLKRTVTLDNSEVWSWQAKVNVVIKNPDGETTLIAQRTFFEPFYGKFAWFKTWEPHKRTLQVTPYHVKTYIEMCLRK